MTRFQQKIVEIGGLRLGVELAHHQGDLAAMVGGMVGEMLHELAEFDLRFAEWNQSLEGLVCCAIHEGDLLLLDFGPLRLHGGDAGKCVGIEQGGYAFVQIGVEGVVGTRLVPIGEPSPLAGDDVDERVAQRAEGAAQVAGELLGAEHGGCLQGSVVGPAVVFVEQLNVVFVHGVILPARG